MLNTIKKILQRNKNAFVVVVENDQPVFVITSFDEYERLFGGNDSAPEEDLFQVKDPLEEVNREIINLGAPKEAAIQIPQEAAFQIPQEAAFQIPQEAAFQIPQEADIQIIEESPQEMQSMQEIKVEDIPL